MEVGPRWAVLVALWVAWLAQPGSAATLCVGPAAEVTAVVCDASFATIGAAVNASSPLDEVVVGPGTYGPDGLMGGVEVRHPMTIRSTNGSASTILDCEGAPGCRGFVIRGPPGALAGAAAWAPPWNASGVRLEGFTVRNVSLTPSGASCTKLVMVIKAGVRTRGRCARARGREAH